MAFDAPVPRRRLRLQARHTVEQTLIGNAGDFGTVAGAWWEPAVQLTIESLPGVVEYAS
jgi:hypothetical protein